MTTQGDVTMEENHRGRRAKYTEAIALIALFTMFSVSADAATTFSYSGTGTTGLWSTGTNWTPNGTPDLIGDSVVKSSVGNSAVIQDIAAGVTVGSIVNDSTIYTFTTTLSNNITLNQDGAGSGSASIANIGTGSRLVLVGAGTAVLADNLTITNSAASSLSSAGSIAISNVFSGTGNITFSNVNNGSAAGQITFNATNTFTGTVTIAKGAVTFNNQSAFGNISSNTILLGSSGQGDATLTTSNSLGTNSVANDIVVVVGTGGTSVLGSTSVSGAGQTIFAGSLTLNQDLILTSSYATTGGVTVSGVVSGTGALQTVGTVNRLTGVNTYTGDTRIVSGTLQLGAVSGTNTLALQSSTLDLNTADSGSLAFGTAANTTIRTATLGGLKGSRNLVLMNMATVPASITLAIGNNNSSNTYSGTLSGSGSVIKVGTGTQTFTGVQTYTGSTAVTVGTLIVNGTLGSGGVTVSSGATLGGNITAGGTTLVSGTLAVGNSPGTGNFDTLTLQAGSTTETQFNAAATTRGSDFDAINITTALNYAGTLKLVFLGSANNQTFDLFSFGALSPSGSFSSVALYANTTSIGTLTNSLGVWTGNFDLGFGGGTQTFTFSQSTGDLVVAVPEPSTSLLVGTGFVCLLYLVRRRRSVV